MAKFKPGQSGNPSGRPPGAKTTATLIRADLVSEEDVKSIVAKVVEKAKEGDLVAAGMILDRTIAKVRPRVESIAEEAGLAEALQAARLRAASNSGYRVSVLEDLVLASHAPESVEVKVHTGVVGGLVGGDDLPAPRRGSSDQGGAPQLPPSEPSPATPVVLPVFRMRIDDESGGGDSYASGDPYNPMD